MTTTNDTKLKTQLSDFGTSLSQLKEDERNDLQIEQNHYGDYLMIKEPESITGSIRGMKKLYYGKNAVALAGKQLHKATIN